MNKHSHSAYQSHVRMLSLHCHIAGRVRILWYQQQQFSLRYSLRIFRCHLKNIKCSRFAYLLSVLHSPHLTLMAFRFLFRFSELSGFQSAVSSPSFISIFYLRFDNKQIQLKCVTCCKSVEYLFELIVAYIVIWFSTNIYHIFTVFGQVTVIIIWQLSCCSYQFLT